MSLAAPLSRQLARRPRPKVKTGCKTCKKRRVKCDEQRPSCLKCTNAGRKCDGYAELKSFQQQVISFALDSLSGPQKSVSTLSEFGENVHYLEFYHHCVGPMLSGRFDPEFWLGIVLQMAHSEPAVRDALIALGHLNKHETGSLEHARRSTATKGDSELGKFWLHYNKSVRCLVNRMADASYTPEVGLVTCLLFVCVEFLRGDTATAVTHLRNGLKIIHELLKNRHVDSPKQQNGSLQTCVSKSSSLIEKTLMPIFAQSVMSALVHGQEGETVFVLSNSLPPIPDRYSLASISEIRHAFRGLRNLAILLAQDITIGMFQGKPPSASALQRRDEALQSHRTWWRALLAYESSNILSFEDRLNIDALKAAYYTTYISCACADDARQMAFDAYLDEFKACLFHTNILIENLDCLRNPNAHGAANFSLYPNILPALYYVAIRCRCPVTRRNAISLLSRNLPREGMWDPEQHRLMAERVVQLEETEVDERGWPVERTRVWSSVTNADVDDDGQFRVNIMFAKDIPRGREGLWSEWYRVERETSQDEKSELRVV